jgi:phosphatidylserine/phosphatidylglycerophosphate/cardiolipin synthase-like enzyme
VGRAYPGLVVTCLNASRPRDRSHYERFVAYHQSFYREVEATSVTPFSLQTLDRGMVGTLLSMIRHGIADMQPPRGLMRLHDHRSLANDILEALVERGKKHRDWYDADAQERLVTELRARGRNFLDAWERVVDRATDGAAERIYSDLDKAKAEGKHVLHQPTDEPPDDLDERRFVAARSMRDVESNTHVWLRLPSHGAALDAFLEANWPFGSPVPALYCDRRALRPGQGGEYCSLHAKCLAVDGQRAFVSSANFTTRGQERNIETGVLLHDPSFASQLERQWMSLISGGFVLRRS